MSFLLSLRLWKTSCQLNDSFPYTFISLKLFLLFCIPGGYTDILFACNYHFQIFTILNISTVIRTKNMILKCPLTLLLTYLHLFISWSFYRHSLENLNTCSSFFSSLTFIIFIDIRIYTGNILPIRTFISLLVFS